MVIVISIQFHCLLFVSFRKPFDASGGVDELLVAREERMAFGADLDTDVLFGGTRVDDLPAGAGDRGLFVFGVNFRLHLFLLLLY